MNDQQQIRSHDRSGHAPPLPSFHPGSLIAGKYQVDRVLGQGGMGLVLAARHTVLNELVAVKVLLPAAAGSTEAIERFVREARAATRIKNEHVARVSDVGSLEDGTAFMVMELLEGSDLAGMLAARGSLGVREAVDYVLQASEALADAHVMGIVHRDLKPGNLFLTRRSDGSPLVKVLDFGVSKFAGGASPGSPLAMTATSAMLGSPLYMAPEQMMSARDADMRSDIWSLGVILYELLAGRPPFAADTMMELCTNVMRRDAPMLDAARPDVPRGLAEAVARCLQRDRAKRFSNVAAMAAALAPFATDAGKYSVERITSIIEAHGLASTIQSERRPPDSRMRGDNTLTDSQGDAAQAVIPVRKPVGLWLALAALVVAIAAAAVVTFVRRSGAEAVAEVSGLSPSGAPSASSAPSASLRRTDAPSVVLVEETDAASAVSSEPRVRPPPASTQPAKSAPVKPDKGRDLFKDPT